MAISEGDTLPDADLVRLGPDGPETVGVAGLTRDRRVVIFAVPGAFTPTCHSAHMPSFVRTRDGFDAAGIDEVVCVAVNDPFVLAAWSEATGAGAARITMLADPEGGYTRALGMSFDAPGAGLIGRSQRYAMLVEGGRVAVLHVEEARGTCEVSGGEAMLAAIRQRA